MTKCGNFGGCIYNTTAGCISPFNCPYKIEEEIITTATSTPLSPIGINTTETNKDAVIARLTAENAELHARLDKAVILPCKADDTVWCIRAYNNGKGYQIEENSVMEIVFEYGNNMKIKTSLGLFGYDKWTYGLDCFTDPEKAEARLAELKGGEKE